MMTCFDYFSHDTRWYHKKKNKIKIWGAFWKMECPPNNTRKIKKAR
jgi:hypothetical protein